MVGPNRSRSGEEHTGIESSERLDRKENALRAWCCHQKRRRAINEHRRVPSLRWPLPPDSAKRVGRGQRLLEDLRGAQIGAAAVALLGKKKKSPRAREPSWILQSLRRRGRQKTAATRGRKPGRFPGEGKEARTEMSGGVASMTGSASSPPNICLKQTGARR